MGVRTRIFLALLAVVAVALPFVLVLNSDSDDDQVAVGGASEFPFPLNGLQPTPEDFPGRLYPAVAWDGDRLFVAGGETFGTDGIAFRDDGALVSDDGSTELLPRMPTGPLFEPAAVVGDDSVVVVGPSCEDVQQPIGGETPGCGSSEYRAATFDLAEREWTRADPPPLRLGGFESGGYRISRALGLTPDGNALFALGRQYEEQFWLFNFASAEWTRLPDSGLRPDGYCVAGDQLSIVSFSFSANGLVLPDNPFKSGAEQRSDLPRTGADQYVSPKVALFPLGDDNAAWSVSEATSEVALPGMLPPSVFCTESHLISMSLLEDRLYVSAVREPSVWTRSSAPPINPPSGDVVQVPDSIVIPPNPGQVGEPGLRYVPATDSWTVLRDFPPVTSEGVPLNSEPVIVGYGSPVDVSQPPNLPTSEPAAPASPPTGFTPDDGTFRAYRAPAGIYRYQYG